MFDLRSHSLVLGGGSMYERLRRHPDLEYDPFIAQGGLIYDPDAASILRRVHREYICVARAARVPMLVTAGTHKVNRERLERSAFSGRPVNEDHVAFVRALCDEDRDEDQPLYVGATLGPRGDAYRPEEALDPDEAERFHSFQVRALASAGVDVLLAMVMPAVSEAMGLARAMASTGVPYIVSFVIRPTGSLLDGMPLSEAIERIDGETKTPPMGYFVNCVHPTILEKGLGHEPDRVAGRLVGLKANASPKTPEELDGAQELDSQSPEVLAEDVDRVRRLFGLAFIGGCCGTDTSHMEQIAARCTEGRS